jgi:hypothetical protein
MSKSKPTTVEEYLRDLPADRRATFSELRTLLQRSMPKGYQESLASGMITYCVPLEKYPDTYNKQPLGYVALAAQKNHNTLYLMGAYADPAQEQKLKAGFARAGKKLDMGKSCVRFKTLADLPLDVIAEVVASTAPDEYIRLYEQMRAKK